MWTERTRDALLEKHRSVAYKVGYAFFRDRDVAEDVAQETCLRALRSWETYNPALPFEAWFARIALNICRGILRKERRRPAVLPLQNAELLPVEGEDTLDQIIQQAVFEQIRGVLMLLPEGDRRLLVDAYLACVPREQMVAEWGFPTQEALRMRLTRSLRHLRDHLILEE